MVAPASENAIFYSIQSEEAYASAIEVGAVRASFSFADEYYRPAYEYMSEQLEQRVAPCPNAIEESWRADPALGRPERPFPVWAWPAWGRNGDREPLYMYGEAPGNRHVILKFQVPRSQALLSQINVWINVLNGAIIPITEDESDIYDTLKKTDPIAFENKRRETWAHVFETDWHGDEYMLERAKNAALQAVLWEIPLNQLIAEPGFAVTIGGLGIRYKEKRSLVVDYGDQVSSRVGDDLEVSASWCPNDRTVKVEVHALQEGGLAVVAGVSPGWFVVGVRVPFSYGDPLPDYQTSENPWGQDALPPCGLDTLCEVMANLRGCTLIFSPPYEPRSVAGS